jgi:predicted DNA-binding protein
MSSGVSLRIDLAIDARLDRFAKRIGSNKSATLNSLILRADEVELVDERVTESSWYTLSQEAIDKLHAHTAKTGIPAVRVIEALAFMDGKKCKPRKASGSSRRARTGSAT